MISVVNSAGRYERRRYVTVFINGGSVLLWDFASPTRRRSQRFARWCGGEVRLARSDRIRDSRGNADRRNERAATRRSPRLHHRVNHIALVSRAPAAWCRCLRADHPRLSRDHHRAFRLHGTSRTTACKADRVNISPNPLALSARLNAVAERRWAASASIPSDTSARSRRARCAAGGC